MTKAEVSVKRFRAKHGQLVDKKFLAGLTEEEAEELTHIKQTLDESEEAYFAPIKAKLREIKIMADEKVLEGLIHSITKPSSIQIDAIRTDWLLGQRIIELRREDDDKKHNQPIFWLILENGVKIKLYHILALGIEVTDDRQNP